MREYNPFAKLEPPFMLGISPAGERFRALSEKTQLVYLYWWAFSVTARRRFWHTSDRSMRQLAHNIGVCIRKLRNSLPELQAAGLVVPAGANRLKLKGFKEIHAGLKLRDDQGAGQERPPFLSQTGEESPRGKSKSKKPPPPPPSLPPLAKEDGGGGGEDGFLNTASSETWDRLVLAFPALEVVSRSAARRELQGLGGNGQSARFLAVLAEAAADPDVRAPLKVVRSRLADGTLKAATLQKVRRILDPPEPPTSTPPEFCVCSWGRKHPESDAKKCPECHGGFLPPGKSIAAIRAEHVAEGKPK